MAQCQVNQAQTVIINSGQNIIWSQNIAIGGDIYIETAGRLTISSDVTMCQNARIIVKRGGRLVVSGGRIIGSPDWKGIEVWGNQSTGHPNVVDVLSGNYPSSNYFQALNQHGVVMVEQDGIIENASTAIATKRQQPDNNGNCCIEFAGFRGGIIIGRTRARFRNNRQSIEMLSYSPNNISFFDNCTFEYEINGTPSIPYQSFVVMWDVHGVDFTNVAFSVGPSVSANPNSFGIFSIDADYSCSNFTAFNDLPRAIVAQDAMVTSGQIEIFNTFFISPSLGVDEKQADWKGVANAVYRDNNINLQNTAQQSAENKVGLFMDGCTGYEVTNNRFSGANNKNHSGIYVVGSGSQAEIILNNPQFSLAYGILAEDNNGGLQIKCNNFTNTTRNNTWSWDNLANPQGNCNNLNIGPAGNSFSHPCINSNTNFSDFHVEDASSAGNWSYFHNTGIGQPVTCQNGTIVNIQCSNFPSTFCNNIATTDPCSVFPFCRVARIDDAQINISNIQLALSQTPPNTPEYEELQIDLNASINYKELLYNSLIREALSLAQLGDIMPILEEDATHSLQQRRIELYLALKNYTKVSSELANLSRTTLEDNLFYDYYTTLNTLFSSGRTYFDLTSSEEATVRTIASYDFGVSKKAQNIIEFVFGDTFSHTLRFPQSSSKQASQTYINPASQLWTLYPNPTQDILYIELENVALTTEVYIVNIYGQTVKKLKIDEFQTELSIDTSDLPNGTYWTVLSNNSEVLQSQKISIVK